MSVWHRLFSGFSLSLSSLLSFHFSVSGTVGGVFTRLELLASLASSLLWAGDGRCFEEKQLLEDSFLAGLLYRFPSGVTLVPGGSPQAATFAAFPVPVDSGARLAPE